MMLVSNLTTSDSEGRINSELLTTQKIKPVQVLSRTKQITRDSKTDKQTRLSAGWIVKCDDGCAMRAFKQDRTL